MFRKPVKMDNRPNLSVVKVLVASVASLLISFGLAVSESDRWKAEWPRTNFAKHSVPLSELKSGGLAKDGIPPIDVPQFTSLSQEHSSSWLRQLDEREPVISLSIAGDHRAYPLRVLIWHEIVNDTVGGQSVLVTYCPLCNSALVFQRIIDGAVLDFGTTGKLRHSDLVMYDRKTESWWQQFTGEAIVGDMTGRTLKLIPSRLESLGNFKKRFPAGAVLTPSDVNARRYGENPYFEYDAVSKIPFLYEGTWPDDVNPMERVVAVETSPGKYEAWLLSAIRERGRVQAGNIVIEWSAGQLSALDAVRIVESKDIGNVTVRRKTDQGIEDLPYDITFAFAFHAFRRAPIHSNKKRGH
jgi:hypothetical protein